MTHPAPLARPAPVPSLRLRVATIGLACAALLACGGGDETPSSGAAEPSSGAVEQPRDGAASETPLDWQLSDAGLYRVALRPRSGAAPIGPLHEWVLAVERVDGSDFTPRRIGVDGGMPQHGHGFVTQPRVTRQLAPGRFLIEGMKFHMGGEWVLRVEIVGERGADVAQVKVQIGP